MRHGKQWSIPEVLSLQREWELLEWTIIQIAEKHERSKKAILCKLKAEGFITFWDEAIRRDYSVEFIFDE